MNKEIVKALFPEKMQQIEEGNCPSCGKPVDLETEFEDDEASAREYLISGLCLSCQNRVFAEEEDDE